MRVSAQQGVTLHPTTPVATTPQPVGRLDRYDQVPGERARRVPTAARMEPAKGRAEHLVALTADIEATLTRGDAYALQLGELVEKNLGPSATAVGKRLARKWISNAAHHVFTDPHRWLVELVVNAIDASRGTTLSAGQFGMGFLSCLEFLGHAETQGTRVIVDTVTRDGATRVTLSGKASDPDVRLEAIRGSASTGTTVRIVPNDGVFSADTVEGLERQLALLQFNPHAGRARVSVSPTEIVIADSGPGMTPEIIATKLLVPSGSTKGRAPVDANAAALAPELVRWAGKHSPNLSFALIEIAGVVVVANEIHPPALDANGNVTDVLLRMPQWTRVTLDRDEIILDSHGASAEEAYLRRVIDTTLDHTCEIGGAESATTLAALYTSLRTWEDTSASAYLAGRPLTRYMKTALAQRIAADDRIVPLPGDDYASFASVVARTPHGYRFIPLPGELVDFDYRRAEQRIAPLFPPTNELGRSGYEGQLIDGKTVVFVPAELLPKTPRGTPRIVSFGLRDTLFVPSSYLRNTTKAQLRRRIIHTHAAGFAQLSPAKLHVATGKATSFVDRALLVTNAPARPIEEFSFFRGSNEGVEGDRAWRRDYADAVRSANARKLIPAAHEAAVRDFWPMMRDHVVRHGKPFCFDSNEHSALSPLTQLISSALYNTFYDAKSEADCVQLLREHGDKCKKDLRQSLAHVAAVIPHADGPVDVDVDALWEAIQPTLRGAHVIDWNDVGSSAWPFFDTVVERLARDSAHLFRAHDPLPLLAHDLGILLDRHGLGDDAYVRLGDDVLWPLPTNATRDDVATLFAALSVGLRDQHRRVALDFRRENELALPGMDTVPRVGELATMQLTLPHVVSPFPTTLTPQRAASIAALVNGQRGLQKSIEGLDVLRNHTASLALLHDVTADPRCTDTTRAHMDRIEQALLHLAVKQADLADGDIAGGYDRGRLRAVAPRPADRQSMRELLHTWPGSAESFAKLVDLQRDHAAMVLDPELRTSMLVNGVFPSYRLDAYVTPWAMLARLRDNGTTNATLVRLVELCRNPSELVYAASVLQAMPTGIDASSSADPVLRAFVERLLQQRLDPHRMRAHALELATSFELNPPERNFLTKKPREHVAIADFASELAAQVEGVSGFPAREHLLPYGVTAAIAHAKPFALGQLIAAQASDAELTATLTRGDLNAAVKLLSDATPVVTTSKLRHNAEHGSERSPMQSALVETVQNSFDAVRSFQAAHGAGTRPHGVAVGVALVKDGDERSSVALTIHDSAGMPSLATLLTDFMLPDYSTKADQAGAVGVMGNGLFQLYADAAEVAMVTRLTSDPSKAYVLHVVPRRENGRIVDLDLRCADISAQMARGQAFGSTLHIRMMPQQRDAALYDAIHAQHFTRETLGAAHVRGADGAVIPLQLAADATDPALQTLTPLAMRASHTAAMTKTVALDGPAINVTAPEPLVSHRAAGGTEVCVLQREPGTRVSQLTTGGVPVMDLARFCRQEHLIPENFVQFIDVGLVVDLPLGSYTPVQSRTDLKLPESTRAALRAALLDAVWLKVFENAKDDLDTIFQYFGSTTPFVAQVGLTPRSVESDIDRAIESRKPMSLLAFMTHHQGVVTRSFASLAAQLLEKTTGVDQALGELTQAYWRVGDELGRGIHAYTIERRVAPEVQRATEVVESAHKAAVASLKASMADMDPRTRALAERVAVPWLDKKLRQAVPRLLREYASSVGTLQVAFAMMGSAKTEEYNAEELAALRVAFAARRDRVTQQLGTYIGALTAGGPPAPTLGFDAPSFLEAMYVPDANHVGLSPQAFPISLLEADLKALAETGTIEPSSKLAKLILATADSAGVINHEIQHWRQRDGDAHAPGYTPDGRLVDFESCASAHHRVFVAEGGLFSWVESIVRAARPASRAER